MTVDENHPTFRQAYAVDKPTIVGMKWWQDAVEEQADAAVSRRGLLIAGGVLGGAALLGVVIAAAADDDDVAFTAVDQGSLEVQKKHGWNFSAITESLVFDGVQTAAFDRTTFTMLKNDLAPSSVALRPYSWSTLMDASTAMPTAPIAGESPEKPLVEELKPVSTTKTKAAYEVGRALADLFANATRDTAIVVDLPGPESVALAAGAAERFEPVCTFDNWPHPRGVVPAHMTLASAAYYQPLFQRTAGKRATASPPLFVLDRSRLSSYTDETRQFDNRYVAKLPPPEGLAKLGIKRVLYVLPSGQTTELDDLNQDFVAYKAAGIDVRMVADGDFTDAKWPVNAPAQPTTLPARLYGGTPESHAGFWADYNWQAANPTAKAPGRGVSTVRGWVPASRTTQFSASKPAAAAALDGSGAVTKSSTVSLGTVALAVAVGTGVILGTRYALGRDAGPRSGRSGSFGRTGSGSGSGWG